METKRCFEFGCEKEVNFRSTLSETYTCQNHLKKHDRLYSSMAYSLESSFDPYQETKEAIINVLLKEITKIDELIAKIIAKYQEIISIYENYLQKSVNMLHSEQFLLSSFVDKIKHTQNLSISEHDPILSLLHLQPDKATKKLEGMIPKNPNYFKFPWSIDEKIGDSIHVLCKGKVDNYLFEMEERLKSAEKALKVKKESSIPKKKLNVSYLTSLLANCNRDFDSLKEVRQKMENREILKYSISTKTNEKEYSIETLGIK